MALILIYPHPTHMYLFLLGQLPRVLSHLEVNGLKTHARVPRTAANLETLHSRCGEWQEACSLHQKRKKRKQQQQSSRE